MSATLRIAVGNACRRTALPLLSYYALTLAVPLANGAALSDTVFVRHALTVFVVPPVAVLLVAVISVLLRTYLWPRRLPSKNTFGVSCRSPQPT